MLLRSSSTPILGSLLASASCSSPHFSDSPSHGGGGKPLERAYSDNLHKLSFHHGAAAYGNQLGAASFSCQFFPSPATPEVDSAAAGVRRVRSDGNLQDLVAAEYQDDLLRRTRMRPGSRRPSVVLESIPSFSVNGSRKRGDADAVPEEEKEEEEEEEEEEEVEGKEGIERSVTICESVGAEFLLPGEKGNVAMNAGEETVPAPLFLARGLGVGDGLIVGFGGGAAAGGGGGGHHPVTVGNGGDQTGMEAYYKKMVEEDPYNALFLRNYAQFLHQSKGDLKRAEEYYSRAILAEPGDGEVLSQYASLIWQLHRDRERASSYFEQAVQAAPQDSHVLAAYAGFLWESEDEEDGGDGAAGGVQECVGGQVSYGALASAHVR